MAALNWVWLMHKTSQVASANTDSQVDLIFERPGADITIRVDPPGNGRERGKIEYFQIDVRGKSIHENAAVHLRINGGDGWLPEFIWLMGYTSDGRWQVLGANPQWSRGSTAHGDPRARWFDLGSNPAGPSSHRIA